MKYFLSMRAPMQGEPNELHPTHICLNERLDDRPQLELIERQKIARVINFFWDEIVTAPHRPKCAINEVGQCDCGVEANIDIIHEVLG